VPSLNRSIVGCAFAPRCAFATDRCRAERPELEMRPNGHLVACFEADRVSS
jgi:oligopeptide/dipeptide ABC transporter ATP-binding protein